MLRIEAADTNFLVFAWTRPVTEFNHTATRTRGFKIKRMSRIVIFNTYLLVSVCYIQVKPEA